ncbi:MAG: HAD-IA family hydrolase [Armatimonadetes bacterium]|nr:HAD-IA family hydrolase [Armatimonadota bacterium]
MIRLVVFDLGGVLVRIAKTWGEAADAASVEIPVSKSGLVFTEFVGFEQYQAGQIDTSDYLQTLAAWLGLPSREEALNVHNGILLRPYDGTADIITEVHGWGMQSGCLSNTNAPHWEIMSDARRFPGPASLQIPGLSHEIKVDKPAKEIYRAYEKIAQADASEILFFDDLPANIQGARDCGWTAELIDPTKETEPQLRKWVETHLSSSN